MMPEHEISALKLPVGNADHTWMFPYVVVAVDCGSRNAGFAKFRLYVDGLVLIDYRQLRIPVKIKGLGERLVLIRDAAFPFVDGLGSRGVVVIEAVTSSTKNGWQTAVVAGAAQAPIRELAYERHHIEADVVVASAWKAALGLPQRDEGSAVRDYVNGVHGLALGGKDEDVADAIAMGEAVCREIVAAGDVDTWRAARAALEVEKRAARKAKRERKAAKIGKAAA